MRRLANTQAWAYAQIAKDENTNARFYVPRVYDFFEVEMAKADYGLIVMEYVKGVSASDIEHNINMASNMSQEEKQNKLRLY